MFSFEKINVNLPNFPYQAGFLSSPTFGELNVTRTGSVIGTKNKISQSFFLAFQKFLKSQKFKMKPVSKSNNNYRHYVF